MKKKSEEDRKNSFRDQKKIEKNPMKKSMKTENFQNFVFFSKKSKIRNFHFSLIFSCDFFQELFGLEKYFFRHFRQIFLISKKVYFFVGFFYINPKFSQESKKHT